MKTFLLILMIGMLGCKPDEQATPIEGRKGYVIAGVVTNKVIYHDFEPDIVFDSLSKNWNFPGQLEVDLNEDGLKDCILSYHWYRGTPNNPTFQSNIETYRSDANKVSLNTSDLHCSVNRFYYDCRGNLTKHQYHDTIQAKKGMWTLAGTTYQNYVLNQGTYYLNGATEGFYYGEWNQPNSGYLGVRFIKDQDTLYGWVRMTVEGYSRITLHDCAIEKN